MDTIFEPHRYTNRAVQSKKMARGLKFRIMEIEGLYYLCNENEGADQRFSHNAVHIYSLFSVVHLMVIIKRQHVGYENKFLHLNKGLKINRIKVPPP